MYLLPARELTVRRCLASLYSCEKQMNFLTTLLLGAHHTPLHRGPQHPSYATETGSHFV